jgi:hypothetical protein
MERLFVKDLVPKLDTKNAPHAESSRLSWFDYNRSGEKKHDPLPVDLKPEVGNMHSFCFSIYLFFLVVCSTQ